MLICVLMSLSKRNYGAGVKLNHILPLFDNRYLVLTQNIRIIVHRESNGELGILDYGIMLSSFCTK